MSLLIRSQQMQLDSPSATKGPCNGEPATGRPPAQMLAPRRRRSLLQTQPSL